eukprot:890949-Amphidinium_carterae.1
MAQLAVAEVIPPPIPPEDNDTTLLVVGIVASVFLFSFCVCGAWLSLESVYAMRQKQEDMNSSQIDL